MARQRQSNDEQLVEGPVAAAFPQPDPQGRLNHTKCHRGGFTLVEIMIVVAIIGLLAAIAVPNYVRARNTSQTKHCINNLRQIDGAKHQWALENRKTDTDTPGEDDLKPYIRRALFPTCPSGGAYTIGAMATDPTCTKSGDGHVIPPQ